MVKGVKLAIEGTPGRVGPLSKMKSISFSHFSFEGPLSGLDWALLSLGWAPET